MSQALGVDEFLTHSTSSGGGQWGKVLKKDWKDFGELEFFLHTRGGVAIPVISHGWYVKKSYEDRQSGDTITSIWSEKWNCHEDPERVKYQYKTDADGNRLDPAQLCPACIFVDFVGRNVRNGKLDILDPLFEWKVGDGRGDNNHVVLHAGGILNLFKAENKDLTKEDLARIKAAGIYQTEAWKEVMWAKFGYVFRLVPTRDPSECKLAVESALLGDLMKAAIRDEVAKMARLAASDPAVDPNRGNPLLHPYPFVWRYNKGEKNFSKRYSVMAVQGVQPTPKVRELITNGELPDAGFLVDKGNCATLRAQMEHAAIGKARAFPWDKIFARAKAAGLMEAGGGSTDPRTSFDPAELERVPVPPAAERVPEVSTKPEPQVPCEHCGKPMGERDLTCPHCGTEYEVQRDSEGEIVVMATRPCGHCGALTRFNDGGESTCAKCGAVHDKDWKHEVPKPEPAKTARRGRKPSSDEVALKAVVAPKGSKVPAPEPPTEPDGEMNWG